MKKFVAVLLCVAMLMAGVVAQAEKGYEFIKYFLNDEEGGNLGYSSSMELTKTNTNKLVVVIFDFSDNSVYLLGDNSAGKYEGTVWNPEQFDFLNALTILCGGWKTINDLVESDYTLGIRIDFAEGDPIVIMTEEEADEMHKIIMDAINN